MTCTFNLGLALESSVVEHLVHADADDFNDRHSCDDLDDASTLTRGNNSCTLNDNMDLPSVKSSTQVPVLFTSGEVQTIVGLTQRKLGYWDHSALVRPHGRPAQGSGSRRMYTLFDVVRLKLIHRLRQAGLSLQKIRRALITLYDLSDEPAPLTELEVVTDGQRILVRKSNEQLLDPLARQYFLRLPLAEMLNEIEQEVASFPADGVNQGADGVNQGIEGIGSVGVPR